MNIKIKTNKKHLMIIMCYTKTGFKGCIHFETKASSFLRDEEDIKGEVPKETRLVDRKGHTKAEGAQL